ncbi:hypothetical protein SPJ2_1705 [Streptococcus parauberis KRS-02109]|nr:hypothetical protein SPJ2_1705 [Streptococcus parauberis KRS-02109]
MSLLSKSTVSTGINSPPKAISKAVKLPSPPSAIAIVCTVASLSTNKIAVLLVRFNSLLVTNWEYNRIRTFFTIRIC